MRALSSPREREIGEWEWLCGVLASRYFAPGLERDDLMQEARIGIAKGLRDFNPERGSTLESFIWHAAERQVMTAVKTAHRQKCRALNTATSLDEPVPTPDGDVSRHEVLSDASADIVDLLAVRERLQEAATLLRERLTDLECACLVGHLSDLSYVAIATEYGISTKSVDNALQRAHLKLNRAVA